MSGRQVACRSCGSAGLRAILSLGRLPLANALLRAEQLGQAEPRYPLDLAFCPGCSLVQILETVPPERLFRDYPYLSSVAETAVAEAGALARRLAAARGLSAASLVVEAASNDGYLLQHYREAGVPVLGIEPAVNVAAIAREARGIPTLAEFFSEELAERLARAGSRADVFHAHNVLAHVADLHGFGEGIRRLLKPEGLAVIEVPYVRDLVEGCAFDTIYHEHLCYFSLTALDRFFRRHGLVIHDVERLAIHGGSLRLHVGCARAGGGAPGPRVRGLLAEEAEAGVDRFEFYRGFAARADAVRGALRKLLAGLRREGRRLAAYGASAKGTVLLNFCGIGGETLEFVVDRNRLKQGLYTPGAHLPICAPARLLEAMPDFVLLLTWNFADEIMAQQAEYRRRGGRFIVPIPEPRIA